jgi:RNA-directed DNA polymerase
MAARRGDVDSGQAHLPAIQGQPTWRIIRYADDLVILVNGTREDTEALREDVAAVLAPLGLRLSPAKTQGSLRGSRRLLAR